MPQTAEAFYKKLAKQRRLAKKQIKSAKPEKKKVPKETLAHTAKVTLSSKTIRLRRLKNKFKTSCCNEEMFPFISPIKLVLMRRVNKLILARITTFFRVNPVQYQTYRIDPPLDESLRKFYLPSRSTIKEYRKVGRPMPELVGILRQEDDESFNEFNFVLDNG